MVQVLDIDPRGKVAGMLGEALGQGLGNGLLSYFAHRSLQSVLQDKSLKDAPLSERWQAIHAAVAPYGNAGERVFNKQLQIEQQEMNEAEQKVLGRFAAGEEISAKDFSSLSPKTQLAVVKHLKENNTNNLASAAFSKGYKAILDNDADALKEVISDPNTSFDVKKQLSNIKNQFDNRTGIAARDTNRQINNVQNAYLKAIAAERNRLGKPGGYRKEDVAAINEKIASLEAARNKDMQKLLKNPDEYPTLAIWGNPEVANYLPEDTEQQVQNIEEDEEEMPFFDPNNPEHKTIAQRLYQEYGDKEKVREILSQKFKGL